MVLYVVRHASAGTRGRFDGDDMLRPLDDAGRVRAGAIAAALKDRPVTRLVSSRATRCIQTLEPLSRAVGIEIETHDALLEGTRTALAVELLKELAVEAGDAALCSHGDVIPPAIEMLAREGTILTGGLGCAKGAMWELEVRGRDIVAARYRSVRTGSLDLAST